MAYTFQPPEINGDTESLARWLYRLNEYLEYYLNDLEKQTKAQTEKEDNARGVGNQIRIGDTLIQGGRFSYTREETVAGGVATKAVTFAEEFEGRPYSLIVVAQTVEPNHRMAASTEITSKGFKCNLYRNDQGFTVVEYIAIGKYKKGI